jgi:hypothetical protein
MTPELAARVAAIDAELVRRSQTGEGGLIPLARERGALLRAEAA